MQTQINKEYNGETYTYTVQPGQTGLGLSISLQVDGRPSSGVELSSDQIEALMKHLTSTIK